MTNEPTSPASYNHHVQTVASTGRWTGILNDDCIVYLEYNIRCMLWLLLCLYFCRFPATLQCHVVTRVCMLSLLLCMLFPATQCCAVQRIRLLCRLKCMCMLCMPYLLSLQVPCHPPMPRCSINMPAVHADLQDVPALLHAPCHPIKPCCIMSTPAVHGAVLADLHAVPAMPAILHVPETQ